MFRVYANKWIALFLMKCWITKMVIPVNGVSEGEALCDEPRCLGAKIPLDVLWGRDVKKLSERQP